MNDDDLDEVFAGVQLFWIIYAFGIVVFAPLTESTFQSFALGGILMFTVFSYWKLEDIQESISSASENSEPEIVMLEVVEG